MPKKMRLELPRRNELWTRWFFGETGGQGRHGEAVLLGLGSTP
jgi:hypothetical protein